MISALRTSQHASPTTTTSSSSSLTGAAGAASLATASLTSSLTSSTNMNSSSGSGSGSNNFIFDGSNSILQNYRLVKQSGTAGQEFVWKIYDAVRNKDDKQVSVFLFEKKTAEKLHKPKRKEIVTDILRRDVMTMTRIKYPKILKVVDLLQESNDSLAFVTEAVRGSLANLLGVYDKKSHHHQQQQQQQVEEFLDVEVLSGVQQICKALHYLHTAERIVHLNISPQNIIVTKKGMWKLAGFGFVQSSEAGFEGSSVRPWQSKQSKMAQPDLDFMAPEVQLMTSKYVTPCCDVFSVAMLMAAIFNGGQSLIQANYTVASYGKQLDQIVERVEGISGKLPEQWSEMIVRMVSRDTRCRPTLQSFVSMQCFDDPVIHCLDLVDSFDASKKADLFTRLPQILPLFPTKLLYTTILLLIKEQLEDQETMIFGLPALLAMIINSTDDEYANIIQPELKKLLNMNKPVQATIYLLENMDSLLSKASADEISNDIMPMLYSTLESNNILGQEAALNVFDTLKSYIEDDVVKNLVLPKAKSLFNKTSSVKTKVTCLECIDDMIESLDKMIILDDVLPFLLNIQCSDADVIMAIIDIYEELLSDRKYGLGHGILASRVMPNLIPFAAIPGLSIEQFTKLMEVLRDMLDEIERQRLAKMANEIPDHVDLERRRTSLDVKNVDVTSLKPLLAASNATTSATNVIPTSIITTTTAETVSRPQHRNSRPIFTTYEPSTSNNNSNNDILLPPMTASRRHSSYQGLEQKEMTALEVLYKQRLASKNSASSRIASFLSPITNARRSQKAAVRRNKRQQRQQEKNKKGSSKHPSILVSEPSVNDFKSLKDHIMTSAGLNPGSRRPSATSMSSMNILDMGQRKLSISSFNSGRRSSFQGICDQAMQLFQGK